MFFLSILSIQCKIRRDRTTDTRRSIGQSRSTRVGHPWHRWIFTLFQDLH